MAIDSVGPVGAEQVPLRDPEGKQQRRALNIRREAKEEINFNRLNVDKIVQKFSPTEIATLIKNELPNDVGKELLKQLPDDTKKDVLKILDKLEESKLEKFLNQSFDTQVSIFNSLSGQEKRKLLANIPDELGNKLIEHSQ